MFENEATEPSISEAAVDKAATAGMKQAVFSRSNTGNGKEKDKQLNKQAEIALDILREGFAHCFHLSDETMPAFLKKEARRAKLFVIPLWWNDAFTQLEDPNNTSTEQDDEQLLSENSWFYPYGIVMLKRAHALLNVLKKSSYLWGDDYQASRVGAPTLIIYTIKEAILRFSRENPSINSPLVVEHLANLTEWINSLQTHQALAQAFSFTPAHSDRTLSNCVEGISQELEKAYERACRERELKPSVDRIKEIMEVQNNIPSIILEILSLLYTQEVPLDFFAHLDQTDKTLIHQDVNMFLSSPIGKHIKTLHDKGLWLQQQLIQCNQLALSYNQGIDVSAALNEVITAINAVLYEPFKLHDGLELPHWFLKEDGKSIKSEIQALLTQLSQAYLYMHVCQSVYQCIIRVGEGWGELGLIERNGNIVPYLKQMKEKLIEIAYLFKGLSPETGHGFFSRLLRKETLTPNAHINKQQRIWRQKALQIEYKVKTSLKRWLDDSIEQQNNVIESLTNQIHLNRIKSSSEQADTVLKSALFDAIFRDRIFTPIEIKRDEESKFTAEFKKGIGISESKKQKEVLSRSYNSEGESSSSWSLFSSDSNLEKTQLEIDLLNAQIALNEANERLALAHDRESAYIKQIDVLEQKNKQYRVRLEQVETLSKTLVDALKEATERYENYIKNLGFFTRLFSRNGFKGVYRAKKLEMKVLTYLSQRNERGYKKVIDEVQHFLQYISTFGGNLNEHSFRTYLLSTLESVEVEAEGAKNKLFAPAYQKDWGRTQESRKKCLEEVVQKMNDELYEAAGNARKYSIRSISA